MGKKWSTVAVSGYQALGVPDDGTTVEANRVRYATITTDLTDPIKTAFDSTITNLDALFTEANQAKTGAYTTTASDHATFLEVTNETTITLIAVATGGAGYRVGVKNIGTDLVTIDGNASELIDGSLTVTLNPQESISFVVDAAGTGWVRLGFTAPLALTTAFHVTLGGTPTATITAASDTVIPSTTQVRNDGDYFQLSGDTSPLAVGENGFTVPITGWYAFSASVGAASNIADGDFARTFLYVDPLGAGSPAKEIGGNLSRTGGASAMTSQITAVLYCNATDVVTVRWKYGSGTNQADGNAKDTFFSGIRLA